jgi:hypothetical protein
MRSSRTANKSTDSTQKIEVPNTHFRFLCAQSDPGTLTFLQELVSRLERNQNGPSTKNKYGSGRNIFDQIQCRHITLNI